MNIAYTNMTGPFAGNLTGVLVKNKLNFMIKIYKIHSPQGRKLQVLFS